MKQLLAFCVLALGAVLLPAAAAGNETPPASASMPSAGLASERQVLVMLRLPPPHFRPDADYAGGYTGDAGKQARRRVAAQLARAHGLTLVAEWPMPVLGVDCFVMATPADVSPAHIADRLSRDPRIEWAQALGMFHALGEHDPLYPLQPSAKYWHVAEIHKLATGRHVTVAVVDSGIEDSHPDLAGQLAIMENFVDGAAAAEAHGTAVAGIIAAQARNGVGMEGIAPDARLMGLRACWQEGAATRCNSFTLAKAIHFAILHEARVINLSLSGPPDLLLQRLLDAAQARGIKVVAAVDPDDVSGGFPASHPGVFAVTDKPEHGAGARRDGAAVLLSFGRDVPATAPGAGWTLVSGPSFAAAHVAGLLALLTELQPALTALQARRQIALYPADIAVAGTVDACATVARVAHACPCACGGAARTVSYP